MVAGEALMKRRGRNTTGIFAMHAIFFGIHHFLFSFRYKFCSPRLLLRITLPSITLANSA